MSSPRSPLTVSVPTKSPAERVKEALTNRTNIAAAFRNCANLYIEKGDEIIEMIKDLGAVGLTSIQISKNIIMFFYLWLHEADVWSDSTEKEKIRKFVTTGSRNASLFNLIFKVSGSNFPTSKEMADFFSKPFAPFDNSRNSNSHKLSQCIDTILKGKSTPSIGSKRNLSQSDNESDNERIDHKLMRISCASDSPEYDKGQMNAQDIKLPRRSENNPIMDIKNEPNSFDSSDLDDINGNQLDIRSMYETAIYMDGQSCGHYKIESVEVTEKIMKWIMGNYYDSVVEQSGVHMNYTFNGWKETDIYYFVLIDLYFNQNGSSIEKIVVILFSFLKYVVCIFVS